MKNRDEKGRYLKGMPKDPKDLKKDAEKKKGNKHGVSIKDKDLRQQAYQAYCAWLSAGWPKETFWFEKEGSHCCYKTIEKYIKENPGEFPEWHMLKAEKARYQRWLNTGLEMMTGKVEKCQPAVFQMFMRNMFGWDREQQKTSEKFRPLVEKLLEKLED